MIKYHNTSHQTTQMIINFFSATSFINFLASAILAILVYLRNRKGQKNIAFAILAGTAALWNLAAFFGNNVTDDPTKALFWVRVMCVFLILIPAAYLHFVLAITETLEKKKILLVFTYILFYIFILTDATPLFVNKVGPIMSFKYWPMATPVFSAWLFCFAVYAIYSSYLLVKKYKTSVGLTKIQIKYVAIGFIVAIIAGSSNLLLWYKILIPPLGIALVPAYVIFMTYAITKYKLINTRIIARNIIFYFAIAFLLYVIFYGVAIIYKMLFGNVLAPESYLTGLFLAPLLAAILYSSNNFLSVFINRYLFPSIYLYQQTMKEASYNLSRHTSISEIGDVIIKTIKKTVQPNGVAVLMVKEMDSADDRFEIIKNVGLDNADLSAIDYMLFSKYFRKNSGIVTRENIEKLIQDTKERKERFLLHEVENQLHQHNIFVCAPLKNSQLLGVIVASNKQYENAYLQEDFDLLETLSHDAQIALENAFLYKKIEKENLYLKEVTHKKKA